MVFIIRDITLTCFILIVDETFNFFSNPWEMLVIARNNFMRNKICCNIFKRFLLSLRGQIYQINHESKQ